MANPRNTAAYEGINAEYVTYKIDASVAAYDNNQRGGSTSVGLAVGVTGPGTVGLTADGDLIEGKLVLVEQDGFCNVQTEGYTSLPAGTGATFTGLHQRAVGALGPSSAKGYIRAALAADALNADAEIIDATDTTNVIVDL
jgi:hypothetical protein